MDAPRRRAERKEIHPSAAREPERRRSPRRGASEGEEPPATPSYRDRAEPRDDAVEDGG